MKHPCVPRVPLHRGSPCVDGLYVPIWVQVVYFHGGEESQSEGALI